MQTTRSNVIVSRPAIAIMRRLFPMRLWHKCGTRRTAAPPYLQDALDLSTQIDAVRGLFDTPHAAPAHSPAAPSAHTPAAAQPTPEGWRVRHGLPIQLNQKAGRSWWRHK